MIIDFNEISNKIFDKWDNKLNLLKIIDDKYGFFHCNICGTEWNAQFSNILNGHGCRPCGIKKSSSKRIISIEEAKNRIFKQHENKIILLEYSKVSEYGKFKCNVCGYEWNAIVNSVCRGNGCKICGLKSSASINKFSFEYVKAFIELKNCKLISMEYMNEKEDLEIEFECGHIKPMNFECFKIGQRCTCDIWDRFKSIIGNKTRLKIISVLSQYELNLICFSDDIVSWDSDITYSCKNGHVVTQKIRSFMRNKYCKICSKEFQESGIATFVKNYCIEKFGKEDAILEYKVLKNPKTNAWLKNDVYIRSLCLTIEINGLQHYEKKNKYHRSEEEFFEQVYRDDLKRNYALQNGKYLEIDLRTVSSKEQCLNIINNFIINIKGEIK